MLAVTVTRNVPLLELDAQTTPYREFQGPRRWDRLHSARNLLNGAGLTLTALGAMRSSRTSLGGPGRRRQRLFALRSV